MHPVERWASSKLERHSATLRGPRRVAAEFKKHTGGRTIFAALVLELVPADSFSLTFVSEPTELDYRCAIEDAIFSALLARYTHPVLRLSVRVLEVREDEVSSNYMAFAAATTQAIEQALLAEDGQSNILWP